MAVVSAQSGDDPAALSLYIEALLRARKLSEALRQIDRLGEIRQGNPTVASLRVRWVRESTGSVKETIKLMERTVLERRNQPDGEAFGRAAFAALLTMGPEASRPPTRVSQVVTTLRPAGSWMPAQVLARRGRLAEALEQCQSAARSDLSENRRGAATVAMSIATGPGRTPHTSPKSKPSSKRP